MTMRGTNSLGAFFSFSNTCTQICREIRGSQRCKVNLNLFTTDVGFYTDYQKLHDIIMYHSKGAAYLVIWPTLTHVVRSLKEFQNSMFDFNASNYFFSTFHLWIRKMTVVSLSKMVILNRWGKLLMVNILWEDKSWEKWTALQPHSRDITVLSVIMRQIMLPVTSDTCVLTLVRNHFTAPTAQPSALAKLRCSPTFSVTQGRRLLCVLIALMFLGKKVILIDTLKDIIEIYEIASLWYVILCSDWRPCEIL